MTAKLHSKDLRSKVLNLRSESGQVLLITIMLLATALTVALSVSFKSTTETQVTKLQEENQKALAAAEAGIESALKEEAGVNIGGLGGLGGFSGTADCNENSPGNSFASPLLQKDEQYTFYFADYPDLSSYWSGDIHFYFKSETDAPALELTFISSTGVITRYLLDPDNRVSAESGETTCDTGLYSAGGVAFQRRTNLAITVANTKVIIARAISGETKIGIGGTTLKSQGKTCESSATSGTTAGEGVTKKMTLLQSFPQIPADFFVTSF